MGAEDEDGLARGSWGGWGRAEGRAPLQVLWYQRWCYQQLLLLPGPHSPASQRVSTTTVSHTAAEALNNTAIVQVCYDNFLSLLDGKRFIAADFPRSHIAQQPCMCRSVL